MSYHAFSLDPRTVLGVGPGASPEEIREAYHTKSKKHHPDVGGDDWAFRMVARAYEVLKATAAARSSQPWEQQRRATQFHPSDGPAIRVLLSVGAIRQLRAGVVLVG